MFRQNFHQSATTSWKSRLLQYDNGGKNITAAAANDSNSPQVGETFAPGDPSLSVLESFQRCYVEPKYKDHERKRTTFETSPRYQLVYHNIPKAGSSSIRRIIWNHFNGTGAVSDGKSYPLSSRIVDVPSYFHFTFFRDPLSRFVSGFSEMIYRHVNGNKKILPPSKYKSFLTLLEHHIHNDTLVTTKTKNPHNRYNNLLSSTEGFKALVEVFELFVRDYDGESPIDVHMTLQVLYKLALVNNATGLPLHFAFHMEDGIINQIQDVIIPALLQKHNYTMQMPNITDDQHVNSRQEQTMNMMDFISDETKRKICRMGAIDYCCLNYPLPTVCQDVITCRWTNQSTPGSVAEREGLLSIEAIFI